EVDMNFMAWYWRAQPELDRLRALSPQTYLDFAITMVADQERFLSALSNGNTEKRWSDMGYVFRQATMPLPLISSISARGEYAEELQMLRRSLISLNDRIIAQGKQTNDADLANRMRVLRCLLASWWFDQPSEIHKELLRIYRDAQQSDKGLEEMIADALFIASEKGYPSDLWPGPAPFRMMWKELARTLSESSHPGERFLGAAMRARGHFSLGRSEEDYQEALRRFPAVYATTTGEPPPGRMTFLGSSYSSILGEVFSQAAALGLGGIFENFSFFARSKTGQILRSGGYKKDIPERSRYLADLGLIRLRNIEQHGNGGLSDALWSSSRCLSSGDLEFSPETLTQLSDAFDKCRRRISTVSNPSENQKRLLREIASWAKKVDGQLAGSAPQKAPLLKVSQLRIPIMDGKFVASNPSPSAVFQGFNDKPAWHGGKLWMFIYYLTAGEGPAASPCYLMEYDLKTRSAVMHPTVVDSYHPLAVTDDHVICLSNYAHKILVGIYDRKTHKWEQRTLLENSKGLEMTAVGNSLVIAFEEASDGNSKGSPRGILVHDIRKNHTDLLASTSRKPPASPLDDPGLAASLGVRKDSKGRVYFGKGRDGKHVAYDLQAKEWIPIENSEAGQFTAMGYEERMAIEGREFYFAYKTRENLQLRLCWTSGTAGKAGYADLPVDYDFSVDETALKRFPHAYDKYQFIKNNRDAFVVYTVPAGAFLANDGHFFFLSSEDMEGAIQKALGENGAAK
ncbi:MAG TPA: hypothetical protein VIS74_00195, partial [Chthoniobacterales bacterium]